MLCYPIATGSIVYSCLIVVVLEKYNNSKSKLIEFHESHTETFMPCEK